MPKNNQHISMDVVVVVFKPPSRERWCKFTCKQVLWVVIKQCILSGSVGVGTDVLCRQAGRSRLRGGKWQAFLRKDLMRLYKHVLVLKYMNRLPILMLQIFKMTILTCGLIHNFSVSLISSYSFSSAPPPLWLSCIILTDKALRPNPRPADWAHSTEGGKTALGCLCHPSGTTSCSQPGNSQLLHERWR